mmetsp:Transcript_22365/g.36969  ORF Transcript_22365/g.36969 Transcript_22365/m.36969 type:complete len:141 (-) Transcript_22365:685-1107(-)|eukprot:CAMPEP_0184365060 /NCGR_PEP_ID=MMETSP1089-20130417/147128_1 /TAXON_ID=38269 ORGANISM="Gloeochaete wittrockiana, Strain SAG46.84" /NCGR_SAMPLE_ID=MMETSP1089 /ASSEMBLY_ACC=CAM_ASM_000445 /LENGTH=140 /DNA_ID=CAMNT_0026706149 /DNA_START=57 /DNA_END=479 /DNA_ORIENTATION=-
MGAEETVIPTRFLVMTSHLIAVIMVLFQRNENVVNGLPAGYSASEYNSLNTQLIIACALSFGLLMVEYVGLFAGFSMFATQVNLLYIFIHATGVLFTMIYILDAWASVYYWYIWGFTIALPAIIEITVISAILCFRLLQY